MFMKRNISCRERKIFLYEKIFPLVKINPIRPLEASDSEARHDDADHTHEFDKDVERWSRSVFEWVANGVTDDGCLVSVRAFTTEVASSTYFLHCPTHHQHST